LTGVDASEIRAVISVEIGDGKMYRYLSRKSSGGGTSPRK
jgi:hypothetical protein